MKYNYLSLYFINLTTIFPLMKKSYKKILSLLAIASMALGMNAETLLVGEGTKTNAFAPIHSTFYDTQGTITQTIYPAELLTDMVGKNINAITLYVNNDGVKFNGGNLRLSMGETSQTSFATTADLVPDLQEVLTAPVVGGTDLTEITFTFTTPYNYAGGNLVLEAYVVEGGDWGYTYFYGSDDISVKNVITRGSLYSFIPKTNFDYGMPADYAARVDVTALDFGKIKAGQTATLNVKLTNSGLNAFTPSFSTQNPFSVDLTPAELAAGEVLQIPVTFAPTTDGLFDGTLAINCGEAGTFEVALHGYAKPESDDITVCDGTSTSAVVPLYQYYSDTPGAKSQVIYPAAMLQDIVDTEILSITFYPTAGLGKAINNMKVYLLETDQAEFTREASYGIPDDGIPETDMVEVATVTIAKDETEVVIDFDAPFKYNGKNLAIQTMFTENSGWVSTNFYGTTQSVITGWYQYNTSATAGSVTQFLPKATFSYHKADTPATVGDVNGDGDINVIDITALIDVIMNDDTSNPRADVNGDGEINVIDITALIDIIMNM